MKFLQVILSFSFLLLVLPSLVVESSSVNDNTSLVTNITRGSSISTSLNDSSYWLSPSGNIAFGFYQLPCTRFLSECRDRYVVGIWFVKSPLKKLVWTANRNAAPLYKPSSILFTKDGKLVLRILPDNKDKLLLPEVAEPVTYAKMHDNGNFVLYGSESQIVWESFDYPTDTILGGQKLQGESDLVSNKSLSNLGYGKYKLSVRQRDGSVVIYNRYAESPKQWDFARTISSWFDDSVSRPVTLNLGTTGKLYLVGSDDVVLEKFYEEKNQYRKEQQEGKNNVQEEDYIYRATLDSEGHFNLYRERIDGNENDNEKSSSNSVLLWSTDEPPTTGETLFFNIVFVFLMVMVLGRMAGGKKGVVVAKEETKSLIQNQENLQANEQA